MRVTEKILVLVYLSFLIKYIGKCINNRHKTVYSHVTATDLRRTNTGYSLYGTHNIHFYMYFKFGSNKHVPRDISYTHTQTEWGRKQKLLRTTQSVSFVITFLLKSMHCNEVSALLGNTQLVTSIKGNLIPRTMESSTRSTYKRSLAASQLTYFQLADTKKKNPSVY